MRDINVNIRLLTLNSNLLTSLDFKRIRIPATRLVITSGGRPAGNMPPHCDFYRCSQCKPEPRPSWCSDHEQRYLTTLHRVKFSSQQSLSSNPLLLPGLQQIFTLQQITLQQNFKLQSCSYQSRLGVMCWPVTTRMLITICSQVRSALVLGTSLEETGAQET